MHPPPQKKKDIVDEVKEEVRKELEKKEEEVETVKGPEVSRPPGIPFINYSRNRFVDISNELFREYLYPNGAKITIHFPLKLFIAGDKSHRIFDADGLSYYIPLTWIGIVWKAKPGAPNFIM